MRRALWWTAIGLPVASLLLNALAWLRYGIDLPIYDDWFGYVTGLNGSFSPHNLFKPLNDTLAPVGYFLDALAQRYLDGNAVPYQLLSMLGVLGALLVLQWRLLALALEQRWQLALCFLLTLLMLQPGSYWGQQNLAYHQALPLVFLLAALLLVLADGWTPWRMATVGVLGLLAGFTYISGAFAGLAIGMALGLAGLCCPVPALGSALRRGGGTLALAGAAASATQFLLAVYPNPGWTHRPDAPLTLPTQAEFWWYLLGKLGRSLALPPEVPLASLAATLAMVALALLVAGALLRATLAGRSMSETQWRSAAMLVALAAAIGVYLGLVAAGRTRLRPPEIATALQVFAFGFERFHFFWATLLWPWVAAGGFVLLRGRARWLSAALGLAVVLGVAWMLDRGVLDHARAHREQAQARQSTIACMLAHLQRGDTIDCPEFVLADVAPAYAYARRTGASFVRLFPVLPLPLGVDDPPPLFRWSRDGASAHVQLQGLERGGAPSLLRATDADPQLLLQFGQVQALSACRLLNVRMRLRLEHADTVQVFFRPQGAPGYAEAWSRRAELAQGDKPELLDIQVESAGGFEDVLRIDPGTRAQAVELAELEVRCQLPITRRSDPWGRLTWWP